METGVQVGGTWQVEIHLLESRADETLFAGYPGFAELLVIAMNKRLLADYDPYASFYRYEVIDDAKMAKDVIRDFMKAPRKERLAFVTLIVLPERKKHS